VETRLWGVVGLSRIGSEPNFMRLTSFAALPMWDHGPIQRGGLGE
jgi:hypothetical protein